MKLRNNLFLLSSVLYTVLSVISCPVLLASEDASDWKELNRKAILLMRQGNYQESERFLRQALALAVYPEDRKSLQVNLALILRKQGKDSDAENIETEQDSGANRLSAEAKSLNSGSGAEKTASAALSNKHTVNTCKPGERLLKARAEKDDINVLIRSLDAQIKEADGKGKLERLQCLFQEKADALKRRDGVETIEYAYCLHFRAQVLTHMHRDKEAQELEARASHLRDILFTIQRGRKPLPPEISRSNIKKLNFHFESSTPASEALKHLQEYEVRDQEYKSGFDLRTRQKENANSGYMNRYKYLNGSR